MFMQMANNRDILEVNHNEKGKKDDKHKRVDNTYLSGLDKMKKTMRTKDPELKKFKKHILMHSHCNVEQLEDREDSDSSIDM
jgi:hypothetical protein